VPSIGQHGTACGTASCAHAVICCACATLQNDGGRRRLVACAALCCSLRLYWCTIHQRPLAVDRSDLIVNFQTCQLSRRSSNVMHCATMASIEQARAEPHALSLCSSKLWFGAYCTTVPPTGSNDHGI
jgi:hypothetical protein